LEKDPLRGNFQNFVPKGFSASQIHVNLVCKFREIWPTGSL